MTTTTIKSASTKVTRRNPNRWWKIWKKTSGRTYLWFDGKQWSALTRPKVFPSKRLAIKRAEQILRENPKIPKLVVSIDRPTE